MYNDIWTEIYHTGVKGQKWGKRRWQNPDGSLTPEGRIHYGYGEGRINNAIVGNVAPVFAKNKSSTGHLTAYGNKSYRRAMRYRRTVDKFNVFNKEARKAAWDKNNSNRNLKKRLKTDEQYNKQIANSLEKHKQKVMDALPKAIGAAVVGSVATKGYMNAGKYFLDSGDKKWGKIFIGAGVASGIATSAYIAKQQHDLNKDFKKTLRKDMYNNTNKSRK